jgi:ABC-type multidrug transport system fused ATPase/permease subunit
MGSFNLIKPFLHKNKYYLLLYSLCILLSYPLESIMLPNIFSSFFDSLKNTTNVSNEFFILFYKKIIGIVVVVMIAHMVTTKLDNYFIPEITESISNTFFEKIIKYYENNYTDLELGKILMRINNLPIILRELSTDFFNWVIPKVFTVIVINLYFLYINKNMFILSIAILIFIIIYDIRAMKECIKLSDNRYEQLELRSEYIQDKLSNLYSIYSAGNTNNEINNFIKISKNTKLHHNKSMSCNNNIKNTNIKITTLILIIFSVMIINLYRTNKISHQQLITLLMVIIFYIPCLNTLITYLPEHINHLGVINNLDNYIDTIYKHNVDKPKIEITQGNIEIRNLTFGYTENKKLFDNFNLTIKSKEKVGIIGPSGNGKSSLIKLIMGYFVVPENSIFIDNQDITKYSLNSLRKQITYINQNTKLFNDTIFNNIKYGNNISNEDILDVYNKYDLDRVYGNLHDGFNTHVGVNGDSISGGQKQIILLLRNYFKPTKIYIFDEPTSALDENTRKIILEMIKEISKNSTLIIITHDKNNLDLIDRQIHLLNGKIKNEK